MYRQKKGNILILNPQEELERLNTARTLFVCVEHAGCAICNKCILDLRDTAVGWDGRCIIFYGHIVEKLFCILYSLADL